MPSYSRRWVKAARYIAYCAAVLAVLVVAAVLFLPDFLDTPVVRAEIQRILSGAVRGEVTWEELRIRILPAPHGVLRKARLEIPQVVSVSAEEATADLRLFPLLRGRAEITSVTVTKPVIQISIIPVAAPEGKPQERAPAQDIVGHYRSVMGPIADAVQKFAPDTLIELEDAEMEVRVPGALPMRLSKLSVRARAGAGSMELDTTAASEYWSGLTLSGRVEYADLSARASLRAMNIKPRAWIERYLAKVPVGVSMDAVRLRAEVRTDARTSLDIEIDAATGSLGIARAGERVDIPDVGVKGSVRIGAQEIIIGVNEVRLGGSKIAAGELRYSAKDAALSGQSGFDLDLAQGMDYTRRLVPAPVRDVLASFQPVTGRAQGRVKLALGPPGWSVGVDISKSDVAVQVRDLPDPVRLGGGTVEIDRDKVKLDRAAVSLLDASAVASVTFDDFKAGPRARGTIAEGIVGENFLAWVWQLARLPEGFELKTPIRVAAPRIAWRPDGAVEVQATAQFDAGPSVAVDIGWASGALDIRRATVKDARSDAELALRAKDRLLEGRFAGSLNSASVAAMLKRAMSPSGAVAGDLRFTIDREQPRRTSATGNLKGEAFDLAALTGWPLAIDRIDLASDEAALHVREATVRWSGQRATLRGTLTRSARGPVIDAQIDSPGINLDALARPEAKSTADPQPKPAAGGKDAASRLWPLPVTGQIAVRADFVQRRRHKIAPVAATLSLEERRAHLDLKQAQLCGISLPLTLEATPQGYSASVRIAAQKQQLEQTAQCLSEQDVVITGLFDLNADVRTQGTLAELPKNLKGTVRADVHDGRVMKFALLGNILSMTNVASLMKEGGPQLDQKGFPYRELIVSGSVAEGRFNLQEGAFHSDALGLAADGWISLTDYSSRLTVLVAPFSRVDELVRKVPLVGYIIGGAFTSVPVGVSGDIRNPLVVPLGPGAISSEVLGIFERTLKLPVKLITPVEGK